MTIRLQHESARVSQLHGRKCDAFCAVESVETGLLGSLYIQADGTWHRFYLDAGLLFWEEGSRPEPVGELLDDERYLDLADALAVKGQLVGNIDMRDSRLVVEFQTGARLALEHNVTDEGTRIIERTASPR